jgi:transposase
MSTSFLYHAFGAKGYNFLAYNFVKGHISIKIEPKAKLLRCSCCGSTDVIKRGSFKRILKTIPIGNKPVFLEVNVPRVLCFSCLCTRRININFAEKRKRYTKSFAKLVLLLAKSMTLKDVAAFLRVGWDLVKDIYKRYLKKRFSKPKLSKLKCIAIDEISIRKGHKYITLVMDLKSGAVVYVGDGKGADALDDFWKRLKASRAKLKAVSTDMGPAYVSAVRENLPGVPLILDRFHVVKLMNEKLAHIRRSLYRELKDTMCKKVLKGSRWILMKNPDNLSKKHDEQERLREALRLNEPLATAYYMKEDLRQIWTQPDKEAAKKVLESWTETAMSSDIQQLVKMGKIMALHRRSILDWYDHPISSGPMEGTNNKIKTMKRQAYGFRDMEFFKLRIMGIHEAKYAITG